jgi:hypothetical protein
MYIDRAIKVDSEQINRAVRRNMVAEPDLPQDICPPRKAGKQKDPPHAADGACTREKKYGSRSRMRLPRGVLATKSISRAKAKFRKEKGSETSEWR